MSVPDKYYVSYNGVHKLCQHSAEVILKDIGKPDVIIAIGGGGFIPSRILRTFLKNPGEKNIPIQAIGLSLYEDMGTQDQIGTQVVRTQWLDFGALKKNYDSLIDKNVLIVDEVDDTRTTLHYALSELYKDVHKKAQSLGRNMEGTKFSIFVVHDKKKTKKGKLDPAMMNGGIYLCGAEVPDKWIAYPWEAHDIDEHTKRAADQGHN